MEDHEKIIDGSEKLKVTNTKSADNESGYEDGVSDGNDTLNNSLDTTDITITLSKDTKDKDDHDKVILDSLVHNTSSLTIDTSTRPPSAISFSSSMSSLPRRRKSKIPIRTKTYRADVKYYEKVKPKPVETTRREAPLKDKKKKRRQFKPLDIWELQKNLKRGEFIEGVISVGGGLNGLITAPVSLEKGRLDLRS